MNAREFHDLRAYIGTQVKVAAKLGVTTRTLQRWARMPTTPPLAACAIKYLAVAHAHAPQARASLRYTRAGRALVETIMKEVNAGTAPEVRAPEAAVLEADEDD